MSENMYNRITSMRDRHEGIFQASMRNGDPFNTALESPTFALLTLRDESQLRSMSTQGKQLLRKSVHPMSQFAQRHTRGTLF